jgi:dimethylglycine dehydrogenase
VGPIDVPPPAEEAAVRVAVTAAGARPFGMWALNALRVEKGYRAWKGDLSTDYTLLQGGLDRFIDWGKAFPGKAALLAERQAGVTKRFTLLTLDEAGDCDPPPMSTLWHEGGIVGEVTTAAYGYRIGAPVALAMLRPDLCVAGTRLEIEVFGEEGKILIASMATSFVVVSPLVRPDLIAKSLYAFPFALC